LYHEKIDDFWLIVTGATGMAALMAAAFILPQDLLRKYELLLTLVFYLPAAAWLYIFDEKLRRNDEGGKNNDDDISE
jgi:hypothetical protein